jgi:predicted MFS family arabinose efflux permease
VYNPAGRLRFMAKIVFIAPPVWKSLGSTTNVNWLLMALGISWVNGGATAGNILDVRNLLQAKSTDSTRIV